MQSLLTELFDHPQATEILIRGSAAAANIANPSQIKLMYLIRAVHSSSLESACTLELSHPCPLGVGG